MQTAQVTGTDPEASEAAFANVFQDARIRALGPGRFRFRLVAHASGPLTLLEYRFGGRSIRATGGSTGFVACDVQLVGEMSDGRVPIDTSLPFLYPARLEATRTESFSRVVDIDGPALEGYAARYLGDDGFRLRITGISPLTPALGRMWRTTALHLSYLMRNGPDDPLIVAATSDLVMAAFLSAFPTTVLDRRVRVDRAETLPAPVRRAQAFIDERYAEPITVGDIAAASRLSLRALQAAFRRRTGTTPMHYLRRVRLEAARRALLDADPSDEATVARVARAAGFDHTSRFAAAYRDRFGELPSQTLRR